MIPLLANIKLRLRLLLQNKNISLLVLFILNPFCLLICNQFYHMLLRPVPLPGSLLCQSKNMDLPFTKEPLPTLWVVSLHLFVPVQRTLLWSMP